MHIGDKVYKLRRTRRLTQMDLAERAGVAQAIISRLERHARDNIHADVLKRLALALGCTTDWLLGMHEDDAPAPQREEACEVAG